MRDAAIIAFVVVVAAGLWVVLKPHRALLDTIGGMPRVVARDDGPWERKRLRDSRRLFAWSDVVAITAWSDTGLPLGPVCWLEFALGGGGWERIAMDSVQWKAFRARLRERFAGLERWDESFPDLDRSPAARIWPRDA